MLGPVKSIYAFLVKYILNENLPWLLLLAGALLLSIMPVYFMMEVPLLVNRPIAAPAFENRPLFNNILLLFHVVLAIAPLFLGPWLFHAKFRKDYPAVHRLIGKIYVVCCLLSAATSLPLALSHASGAIPRIGFGALAVAWFVFTVQAYVFARKKQYVEHRRWMFRSYACTYAFVNVKVYSYMFALLGHPFQPLMVKIMQSCVSWMSNLLLVEIYLAATTYLGVYVGRKVFAKNLQSLPVRMGVFLAVFILAVWISDTFFPAPTEGTIYDDARGLLRSFSAMPNQP